MAIRKFSCSVERVDEYIIEIDEDVMSEEYMQAFRECFYNFQTIEEHAKYLAQHKARFNDAHFIEGYGSPMVDGEPPIFANKDSVERGINIKVIDEDNNCYVDIKEIK